jgi:hypothetical protein
MGFKREKSKASALKGSAEVASVNNLFAPIYLLNSSIRRAKLPLSSDPGVMLFPHFVSVGAHGYSKSMSNPSNA